MLKIKWILLVFISEGSERNDFDDDVTISEDKWTSLWWLLAWNVTNGNESGGTSENDGVSSKEAMVHYGWIIPHSSIEWDPHY